MLMTIFVLMHYNVKAYGFGCLNRTNALATELYAVLPNEVNCLTFKKPCVRNERKYRL